MKRAAFFVMALLALGVPLARAQSEQAWTDPSGRFSLSFSALGWSELTPPADDDPGSLLGIEHRGFQESGRMRTCFVSERRQAGPDDGRLIQANLNVITTTMGVAALERTVGLPPVRSEIITVDGVAAIDAMFDGATRTHMPVFYMKDGSELVQIIISCGAGVPVEPEVENNITALLQTLRINPE